MAVAEIKAREVAPGGDLAGVRVLLNGAGDTNPPCRWQTDPMCEGPWYTSATGTTVGARFNDYTVEVVQQIGSDSFSPGHGVLLGKTKTGSSTCGSFNCFVWYIDSNPQDINQVDYVKADGTPVKATLGDERQTNDGSFNVGTELRLHVRVQGRRQQPALLHHRQAHRRRRHPALHGRRPLARRRRPADARRQPRHARRGRRRGLTRPARSRSRTRARRRRRPNVHPQDASAYLDSDIYRLSASTSRARAGGAPQERARHREVRRDRPGAGLHRQGGRRGRLGLGHADGDVGERSDQDDVRDLPAPTAASAAPSRRRSR